MEVELKQQQGQLAKRSSSEKGGGRCQRRSRSWTPPKSRGIAAKRKWSGISPEQCAKKNTGKSQLARRSKAKKKRR